MEVGRHSLPKKLAAHGSVSKHTDGKFSGRKKCDRRKRCTCPIWENMITISRNLLKCQMSKTLMWIPAINSAFEFIMSLITCQSHIIKACWQYDF